MKKLMLVILVVSLLLTPSLMQRVRIERVNASLSTDIFADATDGYLDSNSIVYSTYPQMSLGDWSNDAYSHCYVKFSLSGVSGALSSATLNLYVYISYHDGNSYAASPLTNPDLGDCQVIHIADYDTIDTSDFSATSIGNDPGVQLSGSATPNVGYVSIDVRAAMQDDMNHGRAWSTFMLQMSTTTDGNSDNDYWVFYTSRDASPAHHPYVAYDLAPVYQGNLILTGNNVTTITGRFDINGSIIVKENATLILQDAIVNLTSISDGIFLQDPANGNPRLQADNATISGNNDNRVFDNSSVILTNCSTDGSWYFNENTDATILNTTADGLQSRENSTVTIINSTIGYLDLVTMNANASVHDLSPGFFGSWDFWSECSIKPATNGKVPHFTLTNSTIEWWSFSFQGSCVSEIAKSEILHLHLNMIGYVRVYDSSLGTIEPYSSPIIELTNSTYSTLDFHGGAQVYLHRYLNVVVTDSLGNNVSLANVTVAFPNSTICGSELADISGNVQFTLMEKMMNATGAYPVGNYTVEAAYLTYSNSTTVNMTGNKQTILALDGLVIPEFPSFLILASFMTAALLTVAVCKRKKWKLRLPFSLHKP